MRAEPPENRSLPHEKFHHYPPCQIQPGRPRLADIDRPLNKRGKRDAPFMGGVLEFRELTPDSIISSPAKRALKTAKLIAAEVGYDAEAIDVRNPAESRV